MQIKLNELRLNNFQGIKSFRLTPGGDDISVFGDNGAGKTTLANSISWVLFDKDSQGKKDFAIKTLDDNGDPIHGLSHEVFISFEIEKSDETENIDLLKSYSEKWVKKRGSVDREFTGHTTEYEINGVPVKKKEYNAKINEIADEDTFKLLTSPTYFNDQLHWSKRREVLIAACGDISDQAIVDSMFPSVDEKGNHLTLVNILNQRSIDDHRKIITSKRKKINDKLKELPARVDEANRALPDKPKQSKSILSKKLSDIKSVISDKQKEKESVESQGGESKLLKKKSDLEAKLSGIRNSHYKNIDEDISALRKKNKAVCEKLDMIDISNRKINKAIQNESDGIKTLERDVGALKDHMDGLRKEYVNLSETSWEGDETCQTCGQDLPEDRIEEAKEKFNINKSDKIEAINSEGEGHAKNVDRFENVIEKSKEIILGLEKTIKETDTVQPEIDSLKIQIENKEQARERYTELSGYKKVFDEIEQVDKDIAKPEKGNAKTLEGIEAEIAVFETKKNFIDDDLSAIRQRSNNIKRIKELMDKERELAGEYEQLEKELYLIEEFIRSKVTMLEDRINDNFKLVKWKLFKQQINEGITEVCEATVNGVPFSSGLNGGAKVNAGLDIINTLSKHYDFYPVIFADNCESVTEILKTEAQMIRLYVSKPDKKLRIEKGE